MSHSSPPSLEIASAFEHCLDEAYATLCSFTETSQSMEPRHVKDLRNRFGAEVAGIIAESVRLQKKAKRKFGIVGMAESVGITGTSKGGFTGPWWAIDPSLQQSTPWQVAKWKASWFGGHKTVDLCCGLGGDSLRFAANPSEFLGIDLNPVVTAIARANLSMAHPENDWEVKNADVTRCSFAQDAWLHIDPDRRASGKRTTQHDHFCPPWDQVMQWAQKHEATLVKLAPATMADTRTLTKPVHRCWISLSGSVREQTLLIGNLCDSLEHRHSARSALVMRSDGEATWFFEPDAPRETERPHRVPDQSSAIAKSVGKWIIDPDAAIRAAGLTESFQHSFELQRLSTVAGFLTSTQDELPLSLKQLSVAKRIVWSGSADDRKLRKTCRENNWSVQTVKLRGTDHSPEKLVSRYRRLGEQPMTLWLGRAGNRVFAAITQG